MHGGILVLGCCISISNFGSGINLSVLCFSLQPFGQIPVLQDGDLTLFGKAWTSLHFDLSFDCRGRIVCDVVDFDG